MKYNVYTMKSHVELLPAIYLMITKLTYSFLIFQPKSFITGKGYVQVGSNAFDKT